MSKMLVLYYSLEGNMAFVAETLASLTGADLEQIVPESEPPKKGLRKFLRGGQSALSGKTVPLKPAVHDPADYDCIVLAAPVWAGTCPPAVPSYLKAHPFSGKTVCLIGGSMSGRTQGLFDKIRSLVPDNSFSVQLSLISPLKKQDETKKQMQALAEALR